MGAGRSLILSMFQQIINSLYVPTNLYSPLCSNKSLFPSMFQQVIDLLIVPTQAVLQEEIFTFTGGNESKCPSSPSTSLKRLVPTISIAINIVSNTLYNRYYLIHTTFRRQCKHTFFTIIPVIFICNTPPEVTSFRLKSEPCTQSACCSPRRVIALNRSVAPRPKSLNQTGAPLPAPSLILITTRCNPRITPRTNT